MIWDLPELVVCWLSGLCTSVQLGVEITEIYLFILNGEIRENLSRFDIIFSLLCFSILY